MTEALQSSTGPVLAVADLTKRFRGLVFGPLLVLSVFVARDGLGGLLRGREQRS